MSYNIPLSNTPQFSSVAGKPASYNGWSFAPTSVLEVINFIGSGNPSDIDVSTIIKKYRKVLAIPATTKIFIKVEVKHPLINGIETPWLTVTGDIADATGDGYELLNDNHSVTTTLSIDSTSIPQGTSSSIVKFKVYTKATGGLLTFEEEKNYYVKLIRLNTSDINIVPSDLIEFHHEIGSVLPSGESRTVNTGSDFTVTVDPHISLSSDGDLSFDFEENGKKTYSGSQSQTVTFTLQNTIETEVNTQPYYYAEAVFLTPAGAIDVQGIKVFVHTPEDEAQVYPESMEFFAIKGVEQAGSQTISIRGLGAWSIIFPSWMRIYGTDTGSNDADRFIAPLFYENLTPGIYTGNITVTLNGEDFVIPVKHTLIDQYDINMNQNSLHFTADRNTISDFYGSNTSKLHLEIVSRICSYHTLITTEKSGDFIRGIYNKKTDFWLGEVIDKLMPSLQSNEKIKSPDFFGTINEETSLFGSVIKYYNPSETDFTVFSKTVLGVEKNLKTFYNLRFIKGRKPSRISSDRGIVDFNESSIRVTKNSKLYLNLYNFRKSTVVRIFKNGEPYGVKTISNNEYQLFGVGLSFAAFTPGDVIEARIYLNVAKENTSYHTQKYIVFPEGKHSYHIGWEDEHGLLQLLEFTGDYSITTEYEGITINTFSKYLERTEKAGTIREAELIANTGWLLKENQERISSLLQAKSAWAFTPSGKINLIPKNGGLSNDDSEKANWAHVVKFKINPDHANKDYTF